MANLTQDRKRAQQIFNEWKAALVDKDKTKSSLLDNFDELFENMQYAGVKDGCAEEFLHEAIVAHLPSKYVLKLVYKRSNQQGISEQEFFEEWKRLITDRANQAFYFRFPLKEKEKEAEENSSKAMSKEEYMRQRRYANSFPTIDLSKIPDSVEDSNDDVSFSLADLEG